MSAFNTVAAALFYLVYTTYNVIDVYAIITQRTLSVICGDVGLIVSTFL